jgi:hypothetical protein
MFHAEPGGLGCVLKPSLGMIYGSFSVKGGARIGAARAMTTKNRINPAPVVEATVLNRPCKTR